MGVAVTGQFNYLLDRGWKGKKKILLRKVHTDQRASLSQSTIITLMSIKMNNCIDTELSDDLLTKCKNATTLTLAKSK